ncbi:MAG: hypothetical protein EA377_04830, partial [Phycisphaerales bacterium]
PHIQLPPGTSGVNVQVAVDPGDPDQIFVLANPDNAFSIGYRIDKHNNQSGNGCLSSPPPASNAFPATDPETVGLSQPTLNWIFAIDCGSFGCAPGFSSFQNFTGPFGISCAPSGDWVMRATYTSLSCTPPVSGGCCLPAGFCEVLTESQCAAQQGLFLGEDVPCSSVNCINLFGACCYDDDSCETPVPQAFCINEGGTWLGSGTDCSNDACGDPVGACCIEVTGACDQFTEEICDIVDGIWQGAGVQCNDIVCFPSGSCCLPDGSCVDEVSPEECEDLDGSFQGNSSTCESTSCPQPQGACCLSNGSCIGLTEQSCINVAGSWAGPGTNCDDTTGSGTADICEEPAPTCTGDLNDDFTVNVFDLLQLLENWGACPGCAADLNDDGTVNVFDLLLLLENWGSCD